MFCCFISSENDSTSVATNSAFHHQSFFLPFCMRWYIFQSTRSWAFLQRGAGTEVLKIGSLSLLPEPCNELAALLQTYLVGKHIWRGWEAIKNRVILAPFWKEMAEEKEGMRFQTLDHFPILHTIQKVFVLVSHFLHASSSVALLEGNTSPTHQSRLSSGFISSPSVLHNFFVRILKSLSQRCQKKIGHSIGG